MVGATLNDCSGPTRPMPNAPRQLSVVLSKQSIAKLTSCNSEDQTSLPDLAIPNEPSFSIRYSVPPDSLNARFNELNLRRTPKGDYIVDEKEDEAAKQPQTTSKLGKPSFRGPASDSRDTDCVLIYNRELGHYELHFLDLEIQTAPALSNRRPIAKSTSNATAKASISEKSRTESPVPHAQPPASTTTQQSHTPQTHTPQTHTPQTHTAQTHAAQLHASQMHAMAAVPSGSRKRTKGLPTRRKIIPKVKQRNPLEDDGEVVLPTLTSANLGSNIQTFRKVPSASPEQPSERPAGHASNSLANSPNSKVQQDDPGENPKPRSALDSNDEEFNDFADELADDLMEASDEEKPVPKDTMGTAGGSAEDDVSSEEE